MLCKHSKQAPIAGLKRTPCSAGMQQAGMQSQLAGTRNECILPNGGGRAAGLKDVTGKSAW